MCVYVHHATGLSCKFFYRYRSPTVVRTARTKRVNNTPAAPYWTGSVSVPKIDQTLFSPWRRNTPNGHRYAAADVFFDASHRHARCRLPGR